MTEPPGLAMLRAAAGLLADCGDPVAEQFVAAVMAINGGEPPLRALRLCEMRSRRAALIERKDQRDMLLRTWRARHFKRDRIGVACRGMLDKAAVIGPDVRRAVERGAMPAAFAGRHHEYLFRLFNLGERMPAKSRLHSILSAAKIQ